MSSSTMQRKPSSVDGKALEPRDDETLFIRLEPRVRAALFRQMSGMSDEEADEILQEAFLALQMERLRKREITSPESWLFRVTQNLALRRRRRARVASLSALKPPNSEPSEVPFDVLDPHSSQPLSTMLHAEMLAISVDALLSLDERERTLVELRDLSNLDFKEIAVRMGMTAENARKRHQRALNHLHDFSSRYSSSMIHKADANTYKPRTREGALRAIHTLPREYAEVLEARYARHLPFHRIPAALGIKSREARRLLARAEELFARKYGFQIPGDLVALFGKPE